MRLVKWLLIIISTVAVLYGAGRLYGSFIMNANVVNELRTEPQGERAGIVMLLTFPSGKMIPVNYLREDDIVYVGADGPWWREFRGEGLPVSLEIRGEKLSGTAVAILDDPERTKAVFKRLRPKVPKWLPDWLNGKLVAISLTDG